MNKLIVSVLKIIVKARVTNGPFFYVFLTASALGAQTLNMAKGEQKILPLSGELKQFSIGNKEIISVRYVAKDRQMLVKAKSIGITDLITWTTTGKKKYMIYVSTKKEQLDLSSSMDLLSQTHLNGQLKANSLWVTGDVLTFKDFRMLTLLAQTKNMQLQTNVSMTKEFKKLLLAKLYKTLHHKGLKNFSCRLDSPPWFDCFADYNFNPSNLSYVINWNRREILEQVNYQLTLHRVSIEAGTAKSLAAGLQYLEGSLGQLNQGGLLSILNSNPVVAKAQNFSLHSLSQQDINLVLDKKAVIKVGAEDAYDQSDSDRKTTKQWKFSGEEQNILLATSGGQYILDYELSQSRKLSSGYAQAQQKSEIYVDLNSWKILFVSRLSQFAFYEEEMPLLSKIPFLGRLFKAPNRAAEKGFMVCLIFLQKKS
jgi:Flp pilus assembly secretin CpaC